MTTRSSMRVKPLGLMMDDWRRTPARPLRNRPPNADPSLAVIHSYASAGAITWIARMYPVVLVRLGSSKFSADSREIRRIRIDTYARHVRSRSKRLSKERRRLPEARCRCNSAKKQENLRVASKGVGVMRARLNPTAGQEPPHRTRRSPPAGRSIAQLFCSNRHLCSTAGVPYPQSLLKSCRVVFQSLIHPVVPSGRAVESRVDAPGPPFESSAR
jgi:hypothetical protein